MHLLQASRLLLLMGLALLAGCGLGGVPPVPRFPDQRDPRELRLAYAGNPGLLDPVRAGGMLDGALVSLIHSGVVRFATQAEVVGDLAQRWELSSDGQVWIFHLRDGIRFSNGDPLHAGDVAFSWNRVAHPATNSFLSWIFEPVVGYQELQSGQIDQLAGIQTPDPQTVELHLAQPFAPMLVRLAMPAATVVHATTVRRLEERYGRQPVGSGPWQLRQWQDDSHLLLTVNQGNHYCPPRLERILFRIIPEPFSQLAELDTGQVDALRDLPVSERIRRSGDENWRRLLVRQSGLNVYYLGIGTRRAPLQDLRARQAVTLALDIDGFIAGPLADGAIRAHGAIPPGLVGYDPAIDPISCDPARARQLWASVPGTATRLLNLYYYNSDPFMADLAESIHADLRRAGISVRLHQVDKSVYRLGRQLRQYDLFLANWVGDYPDPENFLYPLFHSDNALVGSNYCDYANPEVDRLIAVANQTMDASRRADLYGEVEELLRRDCPCVFLWHQTTTGVDAPWLRNMPHPLVFNGGTWCDTRIIP